MVSPLLQCFQAEVSAGIEETRAQTSAPAVATLRAGHSRRLRRWRMSRPMARYTSTVPAWPGSRKCYLARTRPSCQTWLPLQDSRPRTRNTSRAPQSKGREHQFWPSTSMGILSYASMPVPHSQQTPRLVAKRFKLEQQKDLAEPKKERSPLFRSCPARARMRGPNDRGVSGAERSHPKPRARSKS
jgi:hypothetical protein